MTTPQFFDAPVDPAPAWSPENAPEPPPKPLWGIIVERSAAIEVWVRADTKEEADAQAKDIERHFYHDPRHFLDACDAFWAYASSRPTPPEKGMPIWVGDGEWEYADA